MPGCCWSPTTPVVFIWVHCQSCVLGSHKVHQRSRFHHLDLTSPQKRPHRSSAVERLRSAHLHELQLGCRPVPHHLHSTLWPFLSLPIKTEDYSVLSAGWTKQDGFQNKSTTKMLKGNVPSPVQRGTTLGVPEYKLHFWPVKCFQPSHETCQVTWTDCSTSIHQDGWCQGNFHRDTCHFSPGRVSKINTCCWEGETGLIIARNKWTSSKIWLKI